MSPYLHGTPGQKVLETDKDGRITGETNAVQPQAGRDVTLTLDRDLQAAAGGALAGFLDRHPQATGGAWWPWMSGTAGVLAMVSQPGYDAASFSADYAALSQDEAHPLMNRAVQGLYAPGSTFKLVTAAAALEEGFLTPETQILGHRPLYLLQEPPAPVLALPAGGQDPWPGDGVRGHCRLLQHLLLRRRPAGGH